jgi:polysaccharide pyruvyl transferase WcaK-like protein
MDCQPATSTEPETNDSPTGGSSRSLIEPSLAPRVLPHTPTLTEAVSTHGNDASIHVSPREGEKRHDLAIGPSTQKPRKVSFFGHFGSANSGNESTLIAVLSCLRSRLPESEFTCICTNPEVVVTRDGIKAVPITTRVRRIWNGDVSFARRVPMAFVGVGAELRQYARAFRELKGADVLIVPGTGLLTDAFGLANWGPNNLFKWVLSAKLRRCRVLFVSVGAGPLDRTRGRALVKGALALADYRSYRDDASRAYLTGIGIRAARDKVYPDLVFGLPESLLPHGQARSEPTRRVVGLGLMEHLWNYTAADPRPETHTSYLESLAVFSGWLLEHDYDIRLLLGDADTMVLEEFRAVLRARLGSYDEQRIIEQPTGSVEDVLAGLAATDIVVATRFHNVLLALLLNKPAIAISFHHKCSSLMHQMGLSRYCHEIDQIDANRLIEQFLELEQNREMVKRTIAQGVVEARAALDEQYDLLFVNQ